jgi:hypothetical protein
MARAGIGSGGYTSDFMASSEPQPLASYIKLKRGHKAKGLNDFYLAREQTVPNSKNGATPLPKLTY